MTRWRYVAAPLAGGPAIRGLMPADTAADVRASLRRAGLRIMRVEPVRALALPAWLPLRAWIGRWLRKRRRHAKAETFESMATMLDAGVSMVEALETLAGGREAAPAAQPRPSGLARPAGTQRDRRRRRTSAPSRLALRLGDAIRAGRPLAEAMGDEPTWFDGAEVAMARAGEHRGEIAPVLRSLAERHHRSGEVASKLGAALAYPSIVCAVGLGVVVFLSSSTLPQLVGVLRDAGVAPPPLTLGVMGVGRAIVAGWPLALAAAVTGAGALAGARRVARARGLAAPSWMRALVPGTLRQAALACGCLDLSELLRVGVPLTEALRVAAPSVSGVAGAGLARALVASAERLERGESFGQTLDDPRWFDAELVRLVVVGESAGELHGVLRQVGEARTRRARRSVDRLAAMLEPAVIIALAALVGLVVMGAVLPMLRLQEVV